MKPFPYHIPCHCHHSYYERTFFLALLSAFNAHNPHTATLHNYYSYFTDNEDTQTQYLPKVPELVCDTLNLSPGLFSSKNLALCT